MTPQQLYGMKIAIAGLSGGLLGGLVGQYATQRPTMGKTAMGVVLGAAAVGAGYGIYLRTGGDPSAVMAGLDLSSMKNFRARKLRPTVSGCRQVRGCKGQYPPRFARMNYGRSSLTGLGQCYEITPA